MGDIEVGSVAGLVVDVTTGLGLVGGEARAVRRGVGGCWAGGVGQIHGPRISVV